MDHAGALGNASQNVALPSSMEGNGYLFRYGICGPNGPGKQMAAIRGHLDFVHPAADQGHGQFHSNQSGATGENQLRIHVQVLCC